ncbi:hypothetical protein [Yoonia sediminilitoris]|uniref:Uncharacterized protein n=1 Tax=Yoonia sediminilitoris TaxID=1286148 RepID=A0A2T6KN16_9RHOB|nr:hypothetical protein [Yoonia sediminilitoris]PUB17615.1 hypothetical protein C8N45_102627 [Yoonia sediminilitoris]RCW97910.1 hypothetical protein DFP92_102627 [Yoonia sediminilitoris]
MIADVSTMAALWWAVILSGLYHGVNPGMGWPLAVSAALMEGKPRALPKALGLLALGHFLAMLAILLPFSMMLILVAWQVEIRVAAGLLVIAMGIYLVINRRHPRILARVHPARLALWSFLAANAHGAGLMLVPLFLGLCAVDADAGHQAAGDLMRGNIPTAFLVASVHTAAMTAAGGVIAVIIYFWLGLRFLSKTWFNLDLVWALSLIIVGAFGIYSALQHSS